jgi:hypothetical protein
MWLRGDSEDHYVSALVPNISNPNSRIVVHCDEVVGAIIGGPAGIRLNTHDLPRSKVYLVSTLEHDTLSSAQAMSWLIRETHEVWVEFEKGEVDTRNIESWQSWSVFVAQSGLKPSKGQPSCALFFNSCTIMP